LYHIVPVPFVLPADMSGDSQNSATPEAWQVTNKAVADLLNTLDAAIKTTKYEKGKSGEDIKKDSAFDFWRLYSSVTPGGDDKLTAAEKALFTAFFDEAKEFNTRWINYLAEHKKKPDAFKEQLNVLEGKAAAENRTGTLSRDAVNTALNNQWKAFIDTMAAIQTKGRETDGFLTETTEATVSDPPTAAEVKKLNGVILEGMYSHGFKVCGCCKCGPGKHKTTFASAKYGAPFLLAIAGASVAFSATTRSVLPVEMQNLAASGAACALAASAAFVAVSRRTTIPASKSDLELQLV